MATILGIPDQHSKGVVVFTDAERDTHILPSQAAINKLTELKKRWIIGLHHNYWRDHNFTYNPLFDFSIATKDDLVEKDGKPFPMLELSVVNFNDSRIWNFSDKERHWDILNVSKAVKYKRIKEFFQTIRKLYDDGHDYRVLFICPKKIGDSDSNQETGIVELYEKMFSPDERKRFNLLAIESSNLSPFDFATLSFFYKHSKVFVFTSDTEHRPRTPSYAITSGMPVVLMPSVATLFPLDLRKKPFVYVAESYDDFPGLIQEAMTFYSSSDYSANTMERSMNEFKAEFNIPKLSLFLKDQFSLDITNKARFSFEGLDFRLARHHGFGYDPVSWVEWSMDTFLNYLANQSPQLMKEDIKASDPEREILKYDHFGPKVFDFIDKKPASPRFLKRLKAKIRRVFGI